jgi:hypothetical protein
MTRGGSSCSRTLSSSVRPSVSRARRVSSWTLKGSLDQAVPLISITIRATWSPRVISQTQPRASLPVCTCLPRFVLISQLTERDYEKHPGADQGPNRERSCLRRGLPAGTFVRIPQAT